MKEFSVLTRILTGHLSQTRNKIYHISHLVW